MTVSFDSVTVGGKYTRPDLAKLWGYKGHEALCRGVVTPAGDNKIILFVTKEKRPEDTQYHDDLVGSVLLWEGPNNHTEDDRIIEHRKSGDEIHVFFRVEHQDPFTYVGQMTLYCAQRHTAEPSRFVFQAAAVSAGAAA